MCYQHRQFIGSRRKIKGQGREDWHTGKDFCGLKQQASTAELTRSILVAFSPINDGLAVLSWYGTGTVTIIARPGGWKYWGVFAACSTKSTNNLPVHPQDIFIGIYTVVN